jgi:nitroreductase
MSTLHPSALLDQLNWRYAVKKFDPARKLTSEQWTALEDALVLTPSSFGLQPWKFVVVTNPEVKQKLLPVSWGQQQVVDCSHLVVFTVLKHATDAYVDANLNDIAAQRGIPAESLAGLRKVIVGFRANAENQGWLREWATRQVYIALGNLMTAAAVIGVDACPMEGIDSAKYDEVLGLADSEYATAVACAIGHRSADDKYSQYKKVRFPKSQILVHV